MAAAARPVWVVSRPAPPDRWHPRESPRPPDARNTAPASLQLPFGARCHRPTRTGPGAQALTSPVLLRRAPRRVRTCWAPAERPAGASTTAADSPESLRHRAETPHAAPGPRPRKADRQSGTSPRHRRPGYAHSARWRSLPMVPAEYSTRARGDLGPMRAPHAGWPGARAVRQAIALAARRAVHGPQLGFRRVPHTVLPPVTADDCCRQGRRRMLAA